MSIAEVYHSGDETRREGRSWDALLAKYINVPEYRSVLFEVPEWGQDLLLRLYEYHRGTFDHSLRTAVTVDNAFSSEERQQPSMSIPYKKITLAALLHDVGKLQVATSVLDHSGRPTDDQWRQIQLHVVTGHGAIFSYDQTVAEIVGGHHMHQGDKSYGYEGAENVSPEVTSARIIIAAADVTDALGSQRAYKPAWPPEQVRSTLLGEGNFSPELIERVTDARFRRQPFVPRQRRPDSLSENNTVFQARA